MSVVTIDRPDVLALIEAAARRLTYGDKIEAVAMAMRLLDRDARTGTLFGHQPGSVQITGGVDLTAPAFDEPTDAATGRELEH